MFVLSYFTELESLFQLSQPIGQYMLPMVVFWHIINDRVHPCFALVSALFTPIVSLVFLPISFCDFWKPVPCVYLDQQSTAVATKCERRVFVSRTVILFTFVFGVLPSSKERITSFLLDFCFSLSDLFEIVDSLLLVQVKHRVFGFLQVFITKIKGLHR